MTRNRLHSCGLACFILLATQGVSAAPPKTALQLTNEARTSPLFRAEFPAAQVQQRGLATVRMDNDVLLDMNKYLQASSLRAHPHTQALFQPAVQERFLKTAPVYQEKI